MSVKLYSTTNQLVLGTYGNNHALLFGYGSYAAEEGYGYDYTSSDYNDPGCHRH